MSVSEKEISRITLQFLSIQLGRHPYAIHREKRECKFENGNQNEFS